ncbi:MAG: hypothetical protein V1725_02420 [archaeon]
MVDLLLQRKTCYDPDLASRVNAERIVERVTPVVPASRVTSDDLQWYEGIVVEQMSLLVADGRVPLSFADILRKRLDSLGTAEEKEWWDREIHSGDAAFYHPDGRMVIVYDSEIMRGINLNSRLENGVLVIDEYIFNQLRGVAFTREEFRKYAMSKMLSKDEFLANPFWRILARDDGLLEEYADAALMRVTEYRYGIIRGVYENYGEVPRGRLLGIGNTDSNVSAPDWAIQYLIDANPINHLVGMTLKAHKNT